MKKAICMILSAVAAIVCSACGTASTRERAALDSPSRNCNGVAMPVGMVESEELYYKIMPNIDEIVDGYNENLNDTDEPWRVEYAEFYAPVYLVEDDAYGVYIDFDGDNGYIVARDEKTLYEMAPRGDLDYLRYTDKEILYASVDGFMYRDGNGYLRKFVESEMPDGFDYSSGGGAYEDDYPPIMNCSPPVHDVLVLLPVQVLGITLGVGAVITIAAYGVSYLVTRRRRAKAKNEKTDEK